MSRSDNFKTSEENVIWLIAENEEYSPIKVTEENDFIIWGIVVHSIKSF